MLVLFVFITVWFVFIVIWLVFITIRFILIRVRLKYITSRNVNTKGLKTKPKINAPLIPNLGTRIFYLKKTRIQTQMVAWWKKEILIIYKKNDIKTFDYNDKTCNLQIFGILYKNHFFNHLYKTASKLHFMIGFET